MDNELTRNGMVGLELTREEVIGVRCKLTEILMKAQCREVNCDIIDMLADAADRIEAISEEITLIIEGNNE